MVWERTQNTYGQLGLEVCYFHDSHISCHWSPSTPRENNIKPEVLFSGGMEKD